MVISKMTFRSLGSVVVFLILLLELPAALTFAQEQQSLPDCSVCCGGLTQENCVGTSGAGYGCQYDTEAAACMSMRHASECTAASSGQCLGAQPTCSYDSTTKTCSTPSSPKCVCRAPGASTLAPTTAAPTTQQTPQPTPPPTTTTAVKNNKTTAVVAPTPIPEKSASDLPTANRAKLSMLIRWKELRAEMSKNYNVSNNRGNFSVPVRNAMRQDIGDYFVVSAQNVIDVYGKKVPGEQQQVNVFFEVLSSKISASDFSSIKLPLTAKQLGNSTYVVISTENVFDGDSSSTQHTSSSDGSATGGIVGGVLGGVVLVIIVILSVVFGKKGRQGSYSGSNSQPMLNLDDWHWSSNSGGSSSW